MAGTRPPSPITAPDRERLDRQKPLNIHYWTDEYADLCPEVTSGDIWSRTPGRAATPPRCTRNPGRLRDPEEGRNSWVGLYGISATSDSRSWRCVPDDKLAEETCSNAVTLFYYGCATGDVMAAIDDPVLVEAFGSTTRDPGIDQLHATGHRGAARHGPIWTGVRGR
jgi:hypothetical protein